MYTRQEFANLDALTKVQEAVAWLLRRAPLCGLSLLDNYVEIVESTNPRFQLPAIPLMATNYRQVFYNPDYVLRAPVEHVGFLLMHEWLHIFLRHDVREGNRIPLKWNHAADYRINALCAKALNVPIPDYILIPTPAMGDLEAEAIYDLLPDPPPKPQGPSGGVASPEDGSDMLPPSGSEGEREVGIREMAERAALLMGDSAAPLGKLELSWVADRLRKLREVRLPWDQLWVARTSHQLGYEVPNYSKPKKRYLPHMFVPGMLKRRVRDLFIGIDVSGSVTDTDIERFGYVLSQAAKRATKITVATFDQHIRELVVTTDPATLLKQVKFTQGAHYRTDARPVFEEIRKARPRSASIITDGYVELPDTPYPEITWVLTAGHQRPPWGKCLVMR